MVYKASYRGSTVVLKRLESAANNMKTTTSTSSRDEMAAAVESEATRMSNLRHPNTVLFIGVFLSENKICIVRYDHVTCNDTPVIL